MRLQRLHLFTPSLALALVAWGGLALFACVDGKTPDCSVPEAGCGPNPVDQGGTDGSSEGAADAPADAPGDASVDAPADAPIDAPADAPADAPKDAPADTADAKG